MQFQALDEKGPVSAKRALKGKNYLCQECLAPVRLRGGLRRQLHFFHLTGSSCKQHQKGAIHLHLQAHLAHLLPGAVLEQPFPQIGRIADLFCKDSKRIFEVQVSPISEQEVQERTRHYESLGYSVVWILHEKRFNKRQLSAAELFLSQKCRYFSNMDASGQGMIYDQLEELYGSRRERRGKKLPVDLRRPFSSEQKGLYHAGDVTHLGLPFPALKKSVGRAWLKTLYWRLFFLLLRKLGLCK